MTQGSSHYRPGQISPRATLLEDLRILRQLEGAIDRLEKFEAEAPKTWLSLGAMAQRLEQRLDRHRARPRV